MNSSGAAVPSESPSPVLTAAATGAATTTTGWLALAYLCLGHFFIDFYSNALGVFAPLLIAKHGLTLTEAGFLGGLMSFSSSVTQPVWGYLTDRFHSPLFATLAPAASGVLIASLGLAPSYGWLIAMVLLGGLGIASFHPSGSTRAAVSIDIERRQLAMAIFISAGTLGMAFGPSAFSLLFDTIGMSRAWIAAVPGVVTTLILVLLLPDTPSRTGSSTRTAKFDLNALKPVWAPLTILYFCVFLRSVVQISFSALLPLYLSKERGYTLSGASHLLSLYLIAGALGGFAGGQLARRFGGKLVIQISFLGSLPMLALFFFTTGWVSIAGLITGGLLLLFTIPVNVVMAQDLAPSQAGTVSALMMGAAWGMAGLIGIPIIGAVGEHYTLHTALTGLLAAPVLGWILTLWLKTE